MLRIARTIGCLALLALGGQSALGFSLLGPLANDPDAWQIPEIGYGLADDIGAPKNLGEEYRWNTPVIYYAFDQSFLDYFGSNGVWAVDQAIAVLNGLTNFSAYSASLSEVPLETRRVNYRAQALHLKDLKTSALYLTLEELGLTKPDQYIWTLRSRETQPGLSCPWMIYGVIKRSFDPVTWEPSSYINGTLYSYLIEEFCTGTPTAFTDNFAVDPLAVESVPLMSLRNIIGYGLYSTTLTRDDVGGLRYIYGTNNVNWESMSVDSMMFSTNTAVGQQLLLTSNLTLLATQALTNNAAALQALYPDLNILATTNLYTNVWVTNFIPYFYNDPGAAWGTPAQLKFKTTRTLTVQTYYHHTFGNVLTFTQSVNGQWTAVPLPDITTHLAGQLVTVQTTTATNFYSDPFGTPPHTNTSNFTYATNVVSGEYFIIPTNLCGIAISGLQATLVSTVTNSLITTNNATAGTTNTQSFTQTTFYYATNHVFTYYPVDCIFTNTALRQGVNKLTFVRANYDSLVGRFFQPITNIYSQVLVTNGLPVTYWLQRVVTKPDYIYSATDLLTSMAVRTDTAGNYNFANENPGVAGPGNIEPNMQIAFNKVGPLLENIYSTNFILSGISESTATTNFIWGTYDGSTNTPVIYPSGTSIADLEAQILFQILTASLPNGTRFTAYPPAQLQASGGQPPYVWALASGSPALPPGLSLSATGTISGTPTAWGTYGFTVTASGGDGRVTARSLSIIINP